MNSGLSVQATEVKHTGFRMALDGAEQVAATIEATVSSIRVSALPPDSPSLMEGELDYVGELIAEDEGETRRQIFIRDKAQHTHYRGPELVFDIRVHPGVPLMLKVGTASGDIQLHLTSLALAGLEAGAASGAVWAALPGIQSAYPVRIGVASGDVHLKLADQIQLSALNIDTASGDIHLEAGAGGALGTMTLTTVSGNIRLDLRHLQSATARINAVSGDVHARLPEQAPVSVEVRRVLSGSVKIRPDLQRISGSKRTGVWQTAGFDPDAPAVALAVEHIVSGDVRVS